jgi:long-subunit acyl-CoA synthetase (AMP-forming)
MMKELHAQTAMDEILPNVSTLLARNASRFHDKTVFAEKDAEGQYRGISWQDCFADIRNIAWNLHERGFSPGDKMVIFSRNCLQMLETELAVMACGGIAVPIFAHFKEKTAELLINHSDANWLAVESDTQMANTGAIPQIRQIFIFNDSERYAATTPFSHLLKPAPADFAFPGKDLPPQTICLNMYTSGTMGTPKCVQLTHQNILSQQAALAKVLGISERDRFLSYLPWHHSFGGIFELFSALYNGAAYSLESSYGKEPESIFDNWQQVRPTVFFSVPRVYQSLFDLARQSPEAENILFNSGLRFIFTAAASLPERISLEFEDRGIPVIEGWGLTETSPCCTLTDPSLKREPGLVGKPIPGISLRIAEDGEIQVKGPNVMTGYYRNEEANASAFTSDGWYRTGDVGRLSAKGLYLISRKDRIFKLSNGEKVIPSDLERAIELKCHYVQYVVVSGNGQDYPVALIFPNPKLFDQPSYELTPRHGCFCPRNLNELGRCMTGCLEIANKSIGQKFSKIKSAALILGELSLDDQTLTPSMKVAPGKVLEKYRDHLLNLYGGNVPVGEEVYVIELAPQKKPAHVQDQID